LNNYTFDQALQINGFIDDDWKDLSHNLHIENNEARNQSIQVNVPTNNKIFNQLLSERRMTVDAAMKWPQPPPMPQQVTRSLP
jgi:hypothetical protein